MRVLGRLLIALAVAGLLSGCASSPESGMSQEERQKAARTNTQLGAQYMRQDELQRALDKLEKALRQDPEYADAHMVRAILHERLEQPDKAREHFERALDLTPDNPSLQNNYGRFLCDQGEYERAIEYFRRAATNRLYERPQLAWSNAGVCSLNNDEREEAESFLLKALNEDPEFPSALYRMAQLRYQEGHYMSARGFYQRYLAVAEQTPRSLWLGVRIEHELGNEDAVASYSLLLREKYPDSDETRELLEWQDG